MGIKSQKLKIAVWSMWSHVHKRYEPNELGRLKVRCYMQVPEQDRAQIRIVNYEPDCWAMI